MDPRKSNAHRGYRKRVMRRKAAQGQNFEIVPKEDKMNDNMRKVLIVCIVAVVVLCLGFSAIFAFSPQGLLKPTTQAAAPALTGDCSTTINGDTITVPNGSKHPLLKELMCQNGIFADVTSPSSTNQNGGAMVPDPNTVPFTQSTTCGAYDLPFNGKEYVNGFSYPGTTMAGDIEVKIGDTWVSIHDNGSGEYTLLRNPTSFKIEIRGIWGAGCLNGTDQMTMVKGEIQNPNHGDLVAIRDVVIVNEDMIETTFFDKNGSVK